MHIPSARIAREMHSEPACVWFVPANGGSELAILVKAPTTCIKALVSGCDVSLVVAVHEDVLCAGVRIYDVPCAPVLICGVVRHVEEHSSLMRFAADKTSPIFLFNELDASVAWSSATIGASESELLAKLLLESSLYSGPFSLRESAILDRFCLSIDETLSSTLSGRPIAFSEFPISLEKWRTDRISYVGVETHNEVIVDSPDEGSAFEAAAWAALEGIFPGSAWRSPTVTIGDSERELADVLAYYEYGTFLVEAKDLAVLSADPSRKRERRVAGTIKQAKKAIGQLVGASKALRRGDVVRDANGISLSPVITQPMHCIVLLTEVIHDGDWSQVEHLMRKAIADTHEFFHLLDLSELIYLSKIAKSRATHFDSLLIERCRHFAQGGNIHMRVRLAPDAPREGS